MFSLRPISTALSPSAEKDDFLLACRLKLQPWLWKKGRAVGKLEESFEKYLGVKRALALNSGRSALTAVLDALDIKRGDEVLLQAFTCNAAVNPILSRGAKPVFVDVDDTINMDPEDLRKKITAKARAVIIQHTFGWPAQIEKILEIAREKKIYLIEDCAHSLGAKYKGRICGTFGEAAFFSFGRDKVISSVFGGMAVTNDDKTGERLEEFRERLDFPSHFWVFQQLLHPVLVNLLVLPAYGIGSWPGRIILGILHRLSILSKSVYRKEKKGEAVGCFPKRFPNALAVLALNQFRKLERYNEHRKKTAEFYRKELAGGRLVLPLAGEPGDKNPVFMRYPVLVNFETDRFLKEARKRKIYLDDGWRKSPVVPPDTDLGKMGYVAGSCPEAERISRRIINFPTSINISQKRAGKITNFLKAYESERS